MPVGEPDEAVLTVPLADHDSPGTILITVPGRQALDGSFGMPAKFWPRSNDHEPLETLRMRTGLKVFCTRTGGASRHTSFVVSDGAEVSDAGSHVRRRLPARVVVHARVVVVRDGRAARDLERRVA